MSSQNKMLLIKNGELINPKPLGKKDILIAAGMIIAIEDCIDSQEIAKFADIYDAKGDYVMPGLIDQHVHIIGGGGENGFTSRTHEINVDDIISSGVTTVVGVLGTDGVSRSIPDLLAKAYALEIEGVSTRIHTGSYAIPSISLTDDFGKDIAFIDKVIGVKVAMSDHRSSNPTAMDLVKLATRSRVSGLLSGKPGIVHIHVGQGKSGLDPIFEALDMSDLPIRQFSPTHVTRSKELFDEALRFARMGGTIDLTADSDNSAKHFSTLEALSLCPKELLSKLTLSSDGNGSMPKFDAEGVIISMGISSQETLLKTLSDAVTSKILTLPEAVSLLTSNVANNIGLSHSKGHVAKGYDADIIILGKELTLRRVIANGITVYQD
ncbi:MAG: beta-aspartyl-peptidase [Tissierellales bacterium]|nr:beta-aspartyl-peptidase [Tissierellales bacterium]MBN2827391.1 beta-aspartyl-peptidase [Tissierellales bacterium]